jgi:hypothetical protein
MVRVFDHDTKMIYERRDVQDNNFSFTTYNPGIYQVKILIKILFISSVLTH